MSSSYRFCPASGAEAASTVELHPVHSQVAAKVAFLASERALDRLDQEWEAEQSRYRMHVGNGIYRIPQVWSSVLLGVLAVSLWSSLALPDLATGELRLLSGLALAMLLHSIWKMSRRIHWALGYREARRRHWRERRRIQRSSS